MRCPYYNEVKESAHRIWVRGYCDACSEVMVPSLWDERNYCQTHHHIHCPLSQDCRQQEQNALTLAEEVFVGEA